MERIESIGEDVIDLGQASVETKGVALFRIDTDGSPRDYAAGIAAE
jgi:hypothetical protein